MLVAFRFDQAQSGYTQLVDDQMLTNHAAPLPSTQAANPGPGTLTPNQSVSNLSISSNQLSVPAPGSWGGDGFYYDQQTRALGRRYILNFSVGLNTSSARGYTAWNSTTSASYTGPDIVGILVDGNGSNPILYLYR